MSNLVLFENGLDRWGGDLAGWPDEARRDAVALLAVSAPARELHESMLEVERALALPLTGDTGFDRFTAVATRQPQEQRARPMLRRAGWGAAIAAALVLGILIGDTNIGAHDDTPDQVLASALGPSTGTLDVD